VRIDQLGTILIIGGGQAAVQACQSLRRHGFSGGLRIIGDEPVAPYQRPPLSKAFLKGDLVRERLALKAEKFYADKAIDLTLDTRVDSIDRSSKTLSLATGEELGYDKLIIATGATPRALPVPGADLDGVLPLKTIADTDRLRPLLEAGKKLVVIGGGYIGLECAATARSKGLDVTLLERLPRVLARVTAEPVSDFFHQLHSDHGVDLRYNVGVEALVGDGAGEGGHVTGVRLEDGTVLPADIVLVGIGVIPNQQLAEAAGIDCANGILTDLDAVTSDPDIYAIGDCSCHPVPGYGDAIRLESVHNAIDQGDKAAAHICGVDRPHGDTPWFWSDQYDVKLQTVGLFNDFDQMAIRKDADEGRMSVFYFKAGQLIAVDSINDAPSFMAAKLILKLGIPLTVDMVEDSSLILKDHVKAFREAQAAK